MRYFLKKTILFLLPPFVLLALLVGSFFLLDPFNVLKKQTVFNSSIVDYNEDYLATERFLLNPNSYNSFIFGSSRAGCGFQTAAYSKHLKPVDRAYSFCASNETLFGIYGKLRLIDEMNGSIDNALLSFDTDMTFSKTANSTGHLYIKHPRVSKEPEKSFIAAYLKDYFFTGFFIAYLDYCFFKKERPYMRQYLNFNIEQGKEHQPFNVAQKEALIGADSVGYYAARKAVFYARNPTETRSPQMITAQGIGLLKKIKGLLEKHGTRFAVVVTPLYDQKKLDEKDLAVLAEIFGEGHVFDFSGKNAITEEQGNYYEKSHFRARVGEAILGKINR